MIENIKKLLKTEEDRKAEILKKSEASNDLQEVRALSAEMDAVNGRIAEYKAMLAEAEKAQLPEPELDERTRAIKYGSVIHERSEIPEIIKAQAADIEQKKADDKFDTLEYRKAFMEFCLRGTPVGAEYRADQFTAITDAAVMIPTTILNEIIKEMKVRGKIFSRVRKTNLMGGMQVPISAIKPVATRITEAAGSDRQKLDIKTSVMFSYFGLECKIATSLLASVVTLPQFEDEIIPLITEAMITRVEYEVFNGTGTGEQTGILNDSRVKAGQTVTLSSDEFKKWGEWKKKVFAKVPLAYRNYDIFMGAGTFDGYIDGMVDTNGQPIGRVNYGLANAPAYRFAGREVIEVEEDVIKGYDTAEIGDVVAVFVDLSNYAINSNMQMAMYRWFDHDKNQWVDKAILINDGKLLDAAGVMIVKKGA